MYMYMYIHVHVNTSFCDSNFVLFYWMLRINVRALNNIYPLVSEALAFSKVLKFSMHVTKYIFKT